MIGVGARVCVGEITEINCKTMIYHVRCNGGSASAMHQRAVQYDWTGPIPALVGFSTLERLEWSGPVYQV